MQHVKMYATMWCGYCAAARRLFEEKGAEWEEIDVDERPEEGERMQAETHTTTIPQIFIGDTHVGGYDELAALDRAGELDTLLAGAAESGAGM